MQYLIEEKAKEMAIKIASVIEEECKKACEKYNVSADKLIITYRSKTHIEIDIKASDFYIDTCFTYQNGTIK